MILLVSLKKRNAARQPKAQVQYILIKLGLSLSGLECCDEIKNDHATCKDNPFIHPGNKLYRVSE